MLPAAVVNDGASSRESPCTTSEAAALSASSTWN
jgi:hypothetical protein